MVDELVTNNELTHALTRMKRTHLSPLQGLKRQIAMDPLIRSLIIHFVFSQSHPIWEFYSGTSKLDVLGRKLGNLSDKWWMKIPLSEPKFTFGFGLLRSFFTQEKVEKQKVTEDLRHQELLRTRSELQKQAITHIVLRTISALSSHLLASFLRNDGIRGLFKSTIRAVFSRHSPADDFRIDPEAEIENTKIVDEVEAMESELKKSLTFLNENIKDVKMQDERNTLSPRRKHFLLLAIIFRTEAIKLRLILRMRTLDGILTSEVKRRNDCILSLVLNILNATFAYLDAMKLSKVRLSVSTRMTT